MHYVVIKGNENSQKYKRTKKKTAKKKLINLFADKVRIEICTNKISNNYKHVNICVRKGVVGRMHSKKYKKI